MPPTRCGLLTTRARGPDGFVSIEPPPQLTRDTQAND